MTRILVVDDHTLVRDGLCRLLENEPDLEVIATTGSGHEAVQLCREQRPEVVLLDYCLPDLDGLETTRRIVALGLGIHILIVTMHASEEYATRLIRAGATGFVVKAASTEELLTAVRKVRAGTVHVTRAIMEKMVSRLGQPREDIPEACLSNRELQVLVHMARGETTREIAAALEVSTSTVETHRSRLLEKLDLRNVSDVTRFAIRRGLIEPE